MKVIAKILMALLATLLAALVWLMCIPVPPFPDCLMALLAPLVKLIASNQLPELMEVWALLGIWSYLVLATFFGFIGFKIIASRSAAKGSNHNFQRTPNSAAEQ